MDSFRAVDHPEFVDVTGCLELKELMSLIQSAGGLLASSTGPLHLAASLDTPCVGLYGHEAPAWPERWHPVGTKTRWLVAKKEDASGGLDIPIEDVWEAFESLWGAPTPD
jgi:ADP-heptose:LPS heptosyltransferase